MVIESLILSSKAEKNPWEMFFFGILYSSISILLSLWIFREQASLVMVFLIVMAAIPVIHSSIKFEEKKDIEILNERDLLKEHNKAIVFYMFLFLGITLSSVFWYVVLPSPTINLLFSSQMQTIQAINSGVSGNIVQQIDNFTKIFFNNMRVLTFSVLFALIYGAGAIFILTWNATVVGSAMGNFIRGNISAYATILGLERLANYFHIISLGLLKYLIHGVPEIIAYFYGGLAGGILSVAIIRKHYTTEKFNHIITDFAELLFIAVLFLLLAAFIEVYITPALF